MCQANNVTHQFVLAKTVSEYLNAIVLISDALLTRNVWHSYMFFRW